MNLIIEEVCMISDVSDMDRNLFITYITTSMFGGTIREACNCASRTTDSVTGTCTALRTVCVPTQFSL